MAGPSLIRDRRVRVADNLDDSQTPSQIQLAIPSSITEEDLQVFYLSRMREIIFGSPSTNHWFDPFESLGIFPLSSLSNRKTGVPFTGTYNGMNRSFSLPNHYAHVNGLSLDVFHNGRRLAESATADPRFGDFYCVESGGLGTGFDTIVLLTFAPSVRSILVADYQVAP